MKAAEAPEMETATALLRARAKQQSRAAVLAILAIAVLFVLPRLIPSPFDVVAMGFGSAALFNAVVLLNPDSFRNRSGSLTTAVCLATALWLCAVVGTVFSLTGRH